MSSIRRFGLFKCAPLGEQSLFECVAFHDGARKAGNKNANENMRIDERSGRDGKIKGYVLLEAKSFIPQRDFLDTIPCLYPPPRASLGSHTSFFVVPILKN